MSKVYRLHREQLIPAGLPEVWDFISAPKNLQKITPESMNFRILHGSDEGAMYAGMVIMYKVSPVAGIPMRWVTEISHMQPLKYFVDEQRFGPYAFWHHKHLLQEVEGGVLMTDIVDYKIPFGFLGDIANRLFVAKKLRDIFDFRRVALERIFAIPEVDSKSQIAL